jgi:hypothetical protein
MTDAELLELRRETWRLNGNPVRTLDDARSFIESVGFALMYPLRPPVLLPTFIGAWSGSDENLPTLQHAYADPRAQEATDLMVRLLRERDAYEANLFGENSFLVAASIFPFFYAIVGEPNPKQAPKAGSRSGYSDLACDIFAVVQRKGPISKARLQEEIGGGVSAAVLDKSLNELWAKLRITRVDYTPKEGASWDVLYRWAPDAVREGIEFSQPAALSALISKYLNTVGATDQAQLESFFGNFVSRSRIQNAVRALMGIRELEFVPGDGRPLIRLATPVTAREQKITS